MDYFSNYRNLPREIYILFISRIIDAAGSFVQPLLTLILTEKIGLSAAESGLYITILGSLSAPGMIIGGKLTDLIGRKKIILLSQIPGALVLMLCASIKSSSMLLVYLLILSSILYSISSPAYDALLADITVPKNRQASYSLSYMGWNLGYAIGPILGGLLFKNALPFLFFGDGVTTLISMILVATFIGETKGKKDQEINSEKRPLEISQEGSVFHILFQRPILIFFALILFCYDFVYAQWGFALPLQLADLFGKNGAALYGTLASFNGILVIILTPLLTKVTKKIPAITVMSIGGFCYVLSFGSLAFVHILFLFYLDLFIMTIGEILISISSSVFIADHTPLSYRGRISAIIPIVTGAGYVVSPLVIGNFISYASIKDAWFLAGAIVFIAACLMSLLKRIDN
ncbi:MFS transporter [Oenococcus oeni]|uniref:MFS transporter n=4 Tax=Oenococcus oeni TaxID=1247 RepID=UPI00050F99DD|nr:MFS transporter [Oenococcus oeni]KGH54761.1 major facilitator transporter [Oenococcus oeni IOEB_S277]KGH58220.1 major facilitator transporter [Oenococcus oeni IOEB_B10]KGH83214.1 major facilitator transporter [Oenococcus oeni S15]KGH92823.1 major facilitator transporter [Oenococcus oeni S161]KGI06863.1 major facilitator transporter [Oenococcus oeni IOEB_L40_4]